MNAIFAGSLLPFAYGLLVDASWKALLLLLLATAAALAANWSSASVRHRIWCLSFSALILLPVLCAVGPRWKVAFLPGGEASPAVDVRGSGPASNLPAVEIAETDRASDPAPDASQLDPATTAAQSHAGQSANNPEPGETRGPSGMIIRLSFVMLWMVVALALLARLALESAVVCRLVAGCRPLSDDRWNGLLSELQARLRVRRPVRLLECDETIVPVTCGLVRPVILLPAASRDWSLARLRYVLLHELAHVRRHDVFFQMLARTACSLYWFNPLVWYGLGRLRIERELACDDAVVAAGESPVDYADQLVEIARMCRRSRSVVGIAMARSSNLEERVAALLDRARSHRLLSPPTDGLLAGAVLALLIAAAALQPVARAASANFAETQLAVDTTPKSPATTTPPEKAEKRVSTAADPLVLRGRVADPANKPVAGAQVWVQRLVSTDWGWQPVATTDSQGLFRFEVDRATLAKNLKLNEERSLVWRQKVPVRLAATAQGFGFGIGNVGGLELQDKEPPGVAIRLLPDLPVSGRILTVDGQPAAEARVYLTDIQQPSPARLDKYIRDVARGNAKYASIMDFNSVNGIPGQPHNFGEGQPNAVTDREGRFKIRGIGADRAVMLVLRGPSIPNTSVYVVMRPAKESGPHQRTSGAIRLASQDGGQGHYYADFALVCAPTRILQGVVRDHQTRQPIPGVLVQADQSSAVSGADGRFRLLSCEKQPEYFVKASVQPERYISMYVDVKDTAGLAPIDFTIDMRPGILVKGRVTDARTGKPTSGRIRYLPISGNQFLDRFGKQAGILVGGDRIAKDGTYQLQVLPGPGMIGVESAEDSYTVARIDRNRLDEIAPAKRSELAEFVDFVRVSMTGGLSSAYGRTDFKALALIDPAEGSSGLTQNFSLVTGRSVSGVVLGDDGQPLRGARVAGLNFHNGSTRYEKLADERFTVEGIAADEPRLLFFSHSEKKLGARVEIPIGDTRPLTVRLERCGSLVGRIVDAKGQAAAGKSVSLTTSPVRFPQVNLPPENRMLKTDQDGKFRVDGLIPGLAYQVRIRSGPLFSFKLKPAETHDTGTIRLEQSLGARKT
jgi:beta-lactamase regulating signal transducer with metallopeptidase domain